MGEAIFFMSYLAVFVLGPVGVAVAIGVKYRRYRWAWSVVALITGSLVGFWAFWAWVVASMPYSS